jgi:hypothetical protein
MKRNFFSIMICGAAALTFSLTSCKKDGNGDTTDGGQADRWITVSGALMQDEPGDGDGGTMVYSLSAADAKNPNISVNVFDNGMHVKSSRTARLQASADGNSLYNIQYTGDDGGNFNKYLVKGGKNFEINGAEVQTKDYVTTAPRWVKATEGIGVAVNVAAVTSVYEGTSPNFVFKHRRGTASILSLDLNNPKIIGTTNFPLAMSAADEAAGYSIGRLDAPVINKAGNKVFIGAQVSKVDPKRFTIAANGTPTFTADNVTKTGSKTLVLDYPSLANPKIITSTQAVGNTNGYRSTMLYVGTDGNVYQASHGEGVGKGGSKILRISSSTNDYDNSYVFNLDQALSVTDSYIETWKYVGDGIGYVIYSLVNSAGSRTGGYIARVDLNAKTATKMTIPNEATLSFNQYQNIAVNGDDVMIVVTPVSQDGNIYVFNKKTGAMTVGAKLINKTGNRYIGIY